MAKSKSQAERKLGNPDIGRILRYDLFPHCAIRIIEYIEQEKETIKDPSVTEVFDFFHNLLNAFWWKVSLIHEVLYCTDEDLQKSKYWLSYIAGNHTAFAAPFVNGLMSACESQSLMDIFYKALPFDNAGIIFGNFTEYRASTLAARCAIATYGMTQKVTKTIFGKNPLTEISQDNKRLGEWFDEIRDKFLEHLPPSNEWPQWKCLVEAESLTYKIGAELHTITDYLGADNSPLKSSHISLAGLADVQTGEWSNPMTKVKLMAAIGLDSYKTLDSFSKTHPIKRAGSKRLWQIQLDGLSKTAKERLAKG